MLSKKCQKYINQYEDKNYAPKVRKLEKNDLKKHINRNESGKTPETSCGDCNEQSGQVKEKIGLVNTLKNILKETSAIVWEKDLEKPVARKKNKK